MVWASHAYVVEGFALLAAPVLFVCGVLLAFAHTRRWALLWLLLVPVLPPLTVCGITSYQYVMGTVLVSGFPAGYSREQVNLHPMYRVYRSVQSDRPWAQLFGRIQRGTLATLVEKLGPIPGTYQGPYPDRETAYAEIRSTLLLVTPAVLTRPLHIQGRNIQLSPQDLELVLRWAPGLDVENAVVALELFEDTCLLIGFNSDDYYHVELIDTSGFGWFARYVFREDRTD